MGLTEPDLGINKRVKHMEIQRTNMVCVCVRLDFGNIITEHGWDYVGQLITQ